MRATHAFAKRVSYIPKGKIYVICVCPSKTGINGKPDKQ